MHVLQTFDKIIYLQFVAFRLDPWALSGKSHFYLLFFDFCLNLTISRIRKHEIWEVKILFEKLLFDFLHDSSKLLNDCDHYISFIISPLQRIFICSKVQRNFKIFYERYDRNLQSFLSPLCLTRKWRNLNSSALSDNASATTFSPFLPAAITESIEVYSCLTE